METIALGSWNDLKVEIEGFAGDTRGLTRESHTGTRYIALYRGLANSEWELSTTLERSGRRSTAIAEYHRIVVAVHRLLGNVDQPRLPIQEDLDFAGDIAEKMVTNYGFWAYLRHHGFPSPLLDWSQSPYVAAYFAFADKAPKSERVAIFCYRRMLIHRDEAASREQGIIETFGPWEAVDKRHMLQQSHYSFCWRWESRVGAVFYNHESVAGGSNGSVHHIVKYTLPVSERSKALEDLFQMNITPYSLFGTEDSLVATAAWRTIDAIGEQ